MQSALLTCSWLFHNGLFLFFLSLSPVLSRSANLLTLLPCNRLSWLTRRMHGWLLSHAHRSTYLDIKIRSSALPHNCCCCPVAMEYACFVFITASQQLSFYNIEIDDNKKRPCVPGLAWLAWRQRQQQQPLRDPDGTPLPSGGEFAANFIIRYS